MSDLRNKTAFFTLLGTQAFFALFLLVWFVFAGLSVMMFDSPGSEENGGLIALYLFIAAYPLGLIVSIVTSWICYARGSYRKAYWFNSIPLLWLVPITGFWGYALLS